MAIFTNSSFLGICFVRAEGMGRGERVDVTINMITCGLIIEAFT